MNAMQSQGMLALISNSKINFLHRRIKNKRMNTTIKTLIENYGYRFRDNLAFNLIL